MKLKKMAQIMLIGCSIALLSACAAKKHDYESSDASALNDANNVQTSGAGENDSYSDQGANGRNGAYGLTKTTYYFAFDRSDIHPEDKGSILAHADKLVAHPHYKIILEGHTDPRGSREYNIALGERRANAVFDLMKARGVNPSQVRVVSYGSERPAAAGRTEQDFQLDRRVVIVNLQN